MIVMLVAVTTIEDLVVNLRAQHQKSANSVRQKSKLGWSNSWHAHPYPRLCSAAIDD